ncbi:lipopolysaccharide assembly protein LapB [Lacinutrix sp. Bg11-31]|uniref:tetratricopeptide repeat protein n=1 Tax=Lacinutrix sp. Bg11-31 TaxID=2057808 RepID=UPI000C3171AA|nr:tetratricopeptide repeat protein [Lacinutrix sp. Bg11-31]AUC82041.1 tetratricopeptide repeat protein [Lacinutrix sp. Bg11-31]
MKTKVFIYTLLFALILSCGKAANYSPGFIKDTTGRYLFNTNEVIEVYFENNELFLKWRGAEKIEPIYLDKNTYFVKEMNKKIQFLKHPETEVFYISEISEDEKAEITYNYKKLPDSVLVPSTYLKNKEYDKALEGYLAIQKEDSTSAFLNQYDFNRLGYKFLNDKNYTDAIEVFKLNSALHPTSDNVYDSLAEAYAKSGDTLQALENYKMALKYNTGNRRAKSFIAAYNNK